MSNTIHAFVVAAGAICLGLVVAEGCGAASVPEPKTQASAEDEAYKVALDSNDAASISLDIATIALHAYVKADADRRAATCKGSGVEFQACQNREAHEAEANGQAIADAIDSAHKVQVELRKALVEYETCTPGMVDRFCQANAVAKALEGSSLVKKATEEARRKLRNVRSAK